jgi:hypothetical protein
MAELTVTFQEILVHVGYWFVSTMLYTTALSLIWFFFTIPVIREKKWLSERYENFVHKLFVFLAVVAAIGSVLAFIGIGILPYPL